MVNGQLCDPHLQPHAIPEAVVAFSADGGAVGSVCTGSSNSALTEIIVCE